MTRPLPSLFSPFPRAISPHVERVQQAMDRWIDDRQLFQDPYLTQQCCAYMIGWLAARASPHAIYDELEILAKLILWTTVNDDLYDQDTAEQVAPAHARFLAILGGAPLCNADSALCHMLVDIRDPLLAAAPADWMKRFIGNMEGYLDAVRSEAFHRSRGDVPDLATYMRIRARSGVMFLFACQVELTSHAILPDHIRSHALVRQLTYLNAIIISYANDIFSIEKEAQNADFMNLISVLQHAFGLSREQATERAIGIHDHAVAEFVACKAQLPSFGVYDALLQRYIAGLETWISGHQDWYQDSQRYAPKLLESAR